MWITFASDRNHALFSKKPLWITLWITVDRAVENPKVVHRLEGVKVIHIAIHRAIHRVIHRVIHSNVF